MTDLPPSEFPPPPPEPLPPQPPGLSPLNPWLSIWTRPRATMRQILDTDPRRLVHVLAVLGAMGRTLSGNIPAAGPFGRLSLTAIVTVKLCLAVVGGLIGLYIGAGMLTMTGRWLGGRGDFVAVRAAAAWSNVPAIWGALLWLPLLGYLGADALNIDPKMLLDEPAALAITVPLGLLAAVLFFWYIVVALKCLGEAHGFSAWHALGAALIAILILAIPFAILTGILIAMLGLSGALHM